MWPASGCSTHRSPRRSTGCGRASAFPASARDPAARPRARARAGAPPGRGCGRRRARRRAHTTLGAGLGHQALDGELEVIHVLEPQRGARPPRPQPSARPARTRCRAVPRTQLRSAIGSRHCPPSDDQFAVEQACRLARRRCRHLRSSARPSRAWAPAAGVPSTAHGTAAAWWRMRTEVVRSASRCSTAGAISALDMASAARGPTTTRLRRASFDNTYSGSEEENADAAPLSDGEGVMAGVAAQHPARAIHHFASGGGGAQRFVTVAAHEGPRASTGQEAEVLALALVRHSQARGAGQVTHARLSSSPSGKRKRPSSSPVRRASM